MGARGRRMKIWDRLTGRTTEEKVAEYAEVYGEVLLGMHRDVEGYRGIVDQHSREMANGLQQVAEHQQQLVAQMDEVRVAVTVSGGNAAQAAAAACRAAEEAERASTSANELRDVTAQTREALASSERKREEVEKRLFEVEAAFLRFHRQALWAGGLLALGVAGAFIWMMHF